MRHSLFTTTKENEMQDHERLERARRIEQSARRAERVVALVFACVLAWVISGMPQ